MSDQPAKAPGGEYTGLTCHDVYQQFELEMAEGLTVEAARELP